MSDENSGMSERPRDWQGYMDGAVRAGERAAREVLTA
jgi:monoamine oxidase